MRLNNKIIKRYLYIVLLFILNSNTRVFASNPPQIPELWLPGDFYDETDVITEVWWDLISTLIKYVAVIAVLSLMLSWIMYLLSWWEDEKIKKAKNWIIWSLVWVIFSISAWWIVDLINNLEIDNF